MVAEVEVAVSGREQALSQPRLGEEGHDVLRKPLRVGHELGHTLQTQVTHGVLSGSDQRAVPVPGGAGAL